MVGKEGNFSRRRYTILSIKMDENIVYALLNLKWILCVTFFKANFGVTIPAKYDPGCPCKLYRVYGESTGVYRGISRLE